MGVTKTVLILLVECSDGPSNLALRKKRAFISALFSVTKVKALQMPVNY